MRTVIQRDPISLQILTLLVGDIGTVGNVPVQLRILCMQQTCNHVSRPINPDKDYTLPKKVIFAALFNSD